MNKPTDPISATQVLRALKANGPCSPAALTRATGLSRATVHRRLLELQESGFVEGLGATPHRRYRVLSMEGLLLRQLNAIPDLQVATVAQNQAPILSAALELLARLNIGQWNVFCEEMRFHVQLSQLSQLERVEQLIAQAKASVWHLPSNASLGIYNEAVAAEGSLAWQAHRAIRHRLAWDRQPEGSMGVHHDEPLSTGDGVGAVACWSLPDGRIVLLFSSPFKAVLLKALDVYKAATEGDASVLQHFMPPTRTPAATELQACSELLAQANQVLKGVTLNRGGSTPDWSALRFSLSIREEEAVSLSEASAPMVVGQYINAVAAAIPGTVPDDFLLGYQNGQTRILQLGVADASVIRGASYSPQTAVLRARNMARAVAEGNPAGSGRQF